MARDCDALLAPLDPGGQITHLVAEIEALASVDEAVQVALELTSKELRSALDADDDGVVVQLLWMQAKARLNPTVTHVVRRLLRSGPMVITAIQRQLAGPMRSAVLTSAAAELRSRRQNDPETDRRLDAAAQEVAAAFPEQIAPLALAGLIILAGAADAFLADSIYHARTGHHIHEDFH